MEDETGNFGVGPMSSLDKRSESGLESLTKSGLT